MHTESETFCQQHHFLSVPKWISMDELLRILLRFIYHAAAAAATSFTAVAVITTIKQEDGTKKYTFAHTSNPSE